MTVFWQIKTPYRELVMVLIRIWKGGDKRMRFQIITVIIVMTIFALFAYGAYRADKVVEAKAAAKRAELAKPRNKAKKD